MPRSYRAPALDAFRRGDARILVCTDLAMRGLDVREEMKMRDER
jgi:superfamily II DNA/RNA helicase